MLVKNHLVCPYSDCEAHDKRKNLRIKIKVSAEDGKRKVTLERSVKGRIERTSLPYNSQIEMFNASCPFCQRPLIVVIDERHWGRNIYLKQP